MPNHQMEGRLSTWSWHVAGRAFEVCAQVLCNGLAASMSCVVCRVSRHGIKYPANAVRECYTRALEERGLTEECYSSSTERAFTLGGMYRRYASHGIPSIASHLDGCTRWTYGREARPRRRDKAGWRARATGMPRFGRLVEEARYMSVPALITGQHDEW